MFLLVENLEKKLFFLLPETYDVVLHLPVAAVGVGRHL